MLQTLLALALTLPAVAGLQLVSAKDETAPARRATTTTSAAPARSKNELVKQVSKLKFEVSKSAVENEVDGMSQLGTFTALPAFDDGPFSGLRVSSFGKNCLLPRFGVREGDVVAAVQGIPLHTPGDVMDVARTLEKIRPGSKVSVDLRRDGEEITQNYLVTE